MFSSVVDLKSASNIKNISASNLVSRYNGGNPTYSPGKGGISFLNCGWRQNESAYSGRSYGDFRLQLFSI